MTRAETRTWPAAIPFTVLPLPRAAIDAPRRFPDNSTPPL